jgi:hypothetical protein
MFRSRPPNLSPYQALIPIAIGLLGFFLVAGASILNVQNIAWLGGSLDPAQHYLGWALYRNGPWTFPLGLNPHNGLEFSNSIVFSDSLPLLAILIKPFNFLLPEVFQYFGFWTLCCFVLQAWFAWKLVGLMSDSLWTRIFGTFLFVFSPTMMMRVGLWTSLASHFLILAALYLIFRPIQTRRVLYWALLIASASLIHFYLLAMVLALWLASLMDGIFHQKKLSILKGALESATIFLVLFICLWQAGYFSVNAGSGAAGGYGTFRLNLLAPFDPRGWSYILHTIPMQIDFGNGFNYFGLGVLLATVFAIFAKVKKHASLPAILAPREHLFLYVSFIALFLFAVSNTISIGLWNYTFTLPDAFLGFASLLRASGRMFWPVFYFLLLILIVYIVRGFSKKSAILILGVCCVIQIVDTSAGWRHIRKALNISSSIQETPLKNPAWNEIGPQYQNLVRFPVHNQGNDWQYFASYAAIHKMGTNSVFLARLDESRLTASDQKINLQLRTGPLDKNSLYVLDLWKTNPEPILFDPTVDALLRLDGFSVLAPGWKACKVCATLDPALEIPRFAPVTEIGRQIYFSRDAEGRREFLLDGWAPYGEAWGNWSEGGTASMLLPIPAGKPKSLKLQARAFVHEKHPKLDVEILINGVPQKKVSLTEFESNQIDIPLPASLLGRDYFKLELKILNPASPKALGISEDDRQLGLGAISAVFE